MKDKKLSEQAKPNVESLFDDSVAQKPEPYEIFVQWLDLAVKSEPNDAIAMTLSTVDASGLPNARMVLCNRHDQSGFCFFTNSLSAKGTELAAQPKAALLFHWKSLRRQIRVRGDVEVLPDVEADAYFASRPRQSQIGAHASAQSSPLADRNTLIARVEELTATFDNEDVPRPPHWLGYKIVPREMEFWQDGEFRLHNRIRFTRPSNAARWMADRLYP